MRSPKTPSARTRTGGGAASRQSGNEVEEWPDARPSGDGDRGGSALQPLSYPWQSWSLPARIAASLWIAYHVTAMFVSPWAVPPTSQLAVRLQQYVAHYQTLFYLNHGYRFFAPDPGPASVVQFEIVDPSGTSQTGLFPDRESINRRYPRLNYHRWFMWSETLGQLFGQWVSRADFARYLDLERARAAELRQQGLELEADRLERQLQDDQIVWEESEAARQAILTPVARVLLQRQASQEGHATEWLVDGTEIRLLLNRRMIPSLAEARLGMRPADPRLLEPERAFELGRWRWNANAGELELLEANDEPVTESRGSVGRGPVGMESLPSLTESGSHEP